MGDAKALFRGSWQQTLGTSLAQASRRPFVRPISEEENGKDNLQSIACYVSTTVIQMIKPM